MSSADTKNDAATPVTKTRRRALPTPGGRQLPTPGGGSAKKQPRTPAAVTPAASPAPRSGLRGPGQSAAQPSTPLAASMTVSAIGVTPEKVREQEMQIAALSAQLEVARRSALEAQKRMIEAEGNVGGGGAPGELATLQKNLQQKEDGLAKAATKITGLEDELRQAKATDSETLKALQFRMESSKRRNESQAIELGRCAANIEQLQLLLRDKEQIITDYKAMMEGQSSQLSVGQSANSAMKAELESIKIFSAEQTRFVNNLNEENTKLVEEIRRLKKQAITRDKQLKESVELAKNALIKEKEKRTRLLDSHSKASPRTGRKPGQ